MNEKYYKNQINLKVNLMVENVIQIKKWRTINVDVSAKIRENTSHQTFIKTRACMAILRHKQQIKRNWY